MTLITITTYEHPEAPTFNFATISTLVTDAHFSLQSELAYEDGEKKLTEAAAAFNQKIEVREHEHFTVREIVIPLP